MPSTNSEICSIHSEASHSTCISPEPAQDLEINLQKTDTASSSEPYSIYSGKKKWLIVVICCFTGLVSPLSANIYFPALDVIKRVRIIEKKQRNLLIIPYCRIWIQLLKW